jgi:hypothetical protein
MRCMGDSSELPKAGRPMLGSAMMNKKMNNMIDEPSECAKAGLIREVTVHHSEARET